MVSPSSSGSASQRALRAGKQLALLLAACIGAFAALHALGAFTLRAVVPPSLAADGPPLLALGVLSDAHYANVPDALSAWKVQRKYRASLDMVHLAASAWARVPPSEGGVAAIVHLGDAVDGKARGAPGGAGAAFDTVTSALAAAGRPVRKHTSRPLPPASFSHACHVTR
jgi:hypothetical protein